MAAEALVDRLIASGHVPDPLLRAGIRAACASRLRRERRRGPGAKEAFVERLRASPIAEQVGKANEQHYEVPPEFFRLVLGPRLKYSSCLCLTARGRSPRRRTRCSRSPASAQGSRTG